MARAPLTIEHEGLTVTLSHALSTLAELTSPGFTIAVSTETGGVYRLSRGSDELSYVLGPDRPELDVPDSRWLGDVLLTVDGAARRTGLSGDIRTVRREPGRVSVAYAGTAADPCGLRGVELEIGYAAVGEEALHWTIELRNATARPVEVQDLVLPMPMRSWWDGDQTEIYERTVTRHSFVGGDGSYLTWQRPSGAGPILVMVPLAGTHLEFRDKARTGEGPFGEADPAWEGLVSFAVHSAALQPARAGLVEGYLPATSLQLEPGEARRYGFALRWAEDSSHLREVLYQEGVVDVVALPGMVVPHDLPAMLALRARGGIEAVEGRAPGAVEVTRLGARGGYEVVELRFAERGPQDVVVRFDGGRTCVLQYLAIAPLEQSIDLHAEFLVRHQQARGTGRGYEGAFLQWDMSRHRLLTWHDYPGGGWVSWMVGGSDDLGLAPALFLAEKNLLRPDGEQVEAVDYYLEHFIHGYLQSQRDPSGRRTYRVHHWYDGTDGVGPATEDGRATWRVMNYPHVWNTYLAMYRLARTYPGLAALDAVEYLDRAARTMEAYFTHPDVGTLDGASREMGSMGEMTTFELVAALRREGLVERADTLEAHARAKADHLLSRDYPFASEMTIDTTAFEAVYTFAAWRGDEDMVHRVTRASIAARGMQPLWYHLGSDNRHTGESWWNLGYETQLGARQQQQYLLHHDPAAGGLDVHEVMRSTYGAYLAGWANINTGHISSSPADRGAASWQYQSQRGAPERPWRHMPVFDNGWWAWSGEADLGFWGGLRTAAVHVVDDPAVGLYAYGAEMSERDGCLEIVPRDGVRRRVFLHATGGFGIEVERASLRRVVVDPTAGVVTLVLEPLRGQALEGLAAGPAEGEATSSVTMTGLPGTSAEVAVGPGGWRPLADGGSAVVQVRVDGPTELRIEVRG